MKEQFRYKISKGDMKTKYWIDRESGQFEYWRTDGITIMGQILSIVKYYEKISIKLTNRQLYYQLVGKSLIPNAHEVYKRICNIITDMRYYGLIDWDSIEDKARVPIKPAEWDDVKDLIHSATSAYRLPRWSDQEYYVEMYCEKEAGINVLEVVSRKYHMYFGFNKGYSSASAMYDLAQRVSIQINGGKRVIILYFGDHDPSGLDMIRDIRDRIKEFVTQGKWPVDPDFEIIPVSLTMEQIEEYNPPANPAKITDPRAKWYIKQFGQVSWELDAIDAIELRRIAEEAVLEYVDMDLYNEWVRKEQREIKALTDFGKTI